VVEGSAEIVDEVIPKDTEQASMWTLHRQEIERLERIAERFLSFARSSAVELQPVPLGDLHARVVELLRARAENLGPERGVAFTVVLPTGPSAT
jgi:signal transduction histidine kinase